MNPKSVSSHRQRPADSQAHLSRSVGILVVLGFSFAAAAAPPIHQHHPPRGSLEFSISTTNRYVTVHSIPVEVELLKGSPTSMAVVVDTTNFAAAAWTPYVSNPTLTVNVAPREGWHDVWIGLREQREDSWEEAWQEERVKLDLTPPRLVITHPASPIVSQPMIQLLGYCPEPLQQISYDLVNAAGVISNESIAVLDQHMDSRTFEFTANTFQAFDVELATGSNTIIIHATDLAGNMTTTNVTFTVDYSGKTNAPLIRLDWPQDGTRIAGSNSYTWRGWVDDCTAKVTATLTDASGNAKAYRAQVERDGHFWVEHLPAPVGTNSLELTVTDVAGNLSLTNIAVRSSPVLLTIDPPDVSVERSFTTVTGTINSSDYTVWVNGVKAWLNGDGTWIVTNTPVTPGGTAVFQARAIPNSDNGGNGRADGSVISPWRKVTRIANPTASQAFDWESEDIQ